MFQFIYNIFYQNNFLIKLKIQVGTLPIIQIITMKSLIIIYVTLFCCLFTGCNQSIKKTERLTINPITLTKGLEMKRVANFICTDKYLFVQDPQLVNNFIKVYDLEGNFISEFGNIGNGPEEFIVPECIPYKNGVLTWNKYGTFTTAISLDTNKFIQEFIKIPIFNKENLSVQINSDGNYITYNPNKEHVITLFSPEGIEIASAGKLPYPQEISEKEYLYSGKIIYNHYNKKLLLYLDVFPYAAVFTIDKNKITMDTEKKLANLDYTISNHQMQIKEGGKDCMSNCCLTKNYIISILNDPDYKGYDNSQSSPKRFTVGVYDYNLNLVKIVNLKSPRYNLAAQGNDDSFYAIVQNPENDIVKVKL